MSNYEMDVVLPSKGLIYGGKIDPNITLRHITTNEEKKLLASTSDNALDKLIESCVVAPKDFNIKLLNPADKYFLMIKLRAHTYGSDYYVLGKCPDCGHKAEYKVNLDDLLVYELDDDFTQPIYFTTPESGDKLGVRLLDGKQLESVDRQAKKLAKVMNIDKKEMEYVLRMAKHLVSINDEEIDEGSAQGYVEKMHARDSAYFWFKLDEIRLGYDTNIEVTCPNCRDDIEFEMPLNKEFFRPKFR